MNHVLISLTVFVFLLYPSVGFSSPNIKAPNVAGQFYSADADELSQQVDQFLNQADVEVYSRRVPMVIVPHAGYIYSGPTAAYSFKAISRQNIKTVIILAPSHFFGFDGISIWPDGLFETPLGHVSVDEELVRQIQAQCLVCAFEPQAFAKEHSLEVEIPFIQKVFPGAKIVAVIVGQPAKNVLEDFAAALGRVIAERTDIQIVVSTDWSHYHDEMTAGMMDQRAIDLVKKFQIDQLWQEGKNQRVELCGFFPVIAAMSLAKQKGWTHVDVLKTGNSVSATGDKNRVVGYAALAFYADEASDSSGLSLEDKRLLFDIVQDTLNQFVNDGKIFDVHLSTEHLNQSLGIFVTLKAHDRLRGCIGRIVAAEPLYTSARDMAIAAASEDHRFAPVRPDELKDIEVEISVLSQPRDVSGAGEIVLGRHGVILGQGGRQGVFLPQVADETGWSKEEFLSELCSQKADLPRDCWQDPQTRIQVFTADVFAEKDLQ